LATEDGTVIIEDNHEIPAEKEQEYRVMSTQEIPDTLRDRIAPVLALLRKLKLAFSLNEQSGGGMTIEIGPENGRSGDERTPGGGEPKTVLELPDEYVRGLSDSERHRLPSDEADQHDHYLYGTPKK